MTLLSFSFLFNIPLLLAVYIAIKILSPVIILDYIFDNYNFYIVYLASYFNLFSNVTKPIILS